MAGHIGVPRVCPPLGLRRWRFSASPEFPDPSAGRGPGPTKPGSPTQPRAQGWPYSSGPTARGVWCGAAAPRGGRRRAAALGRRHRRRYFCCHLARHGLVPGRPRLSSGGTADVGSAARSGSAGGPSRVRGVCLLGEGKVRAQPPAIDER